MSFKLVDILSFAVKNKASDIHFKVCLSPIFRINGRLIPLKGTSQLTPEFIADLALEILSDSQKERFQETMDLDLSFGIDGVGRFRVNLFQQRETIGMVCRVIPTEIKGMETLFLPKVIEKIAQEKRGMVLVTGSTGSGKSTTIASILEHINTTRSCHIVTIEDPIEFILSDKKGIINQREVGVDTVSFASALRASLRQDPDIVFIGELRDLETIETAMLAADTGHLVVSTVHTIDAAETLNRLVNVFPPHHQNNIRLHLSNLVRGIISQRLLPRSDGKGRVPAVEVLVATPYLKELLTDDKRLKEIPEALEKGHTTYGTQSFDQSLMLLYKNNLITYDEAIRNASNPDDFALKASGISSGSNLWDAMDDVK